MDVTSCSRVCTLSFILSSCVENGNAVHPINQFLSHKALSNLCIARTSTLCLLGGEFVNGSSHGVTNAVTERHKLETC